MKKGLWICVTGLDGTGKTTLKRNLVGHFKMQNLQVKDFKFPYDKHLLDLLNNTVGDGMHGRTIILTRCCLLWITGFLELSTFAIGARLLTCWFLREDILIPSYMENAEVSLMKNLTN